MTHGSAIRTNGRPHGRSMGNQWQPIGQLCLYLPHELPTGHAWVADGSPMGRAWVAQFTVLLHGIPMDHPWATEGSPIRRPLAYLCIFPRELPMGHAWALVGTYRSDSWVGPMGRSWVAHGSPMGLLRVYNAGQWVTHGSPLDLPSVQSTGPWIAQGSPMGHSSGP